MKTFFGALVAIGMACGSGHAAEEQHVSASEVRSWGEQGTFWCLNPVLPGERPSFFAIWQPTRSGAFEVVSGERVAADGIFTVTQPFTIEGDRQCYTVEPANIHFGKAGDAPEAAIQDARRRWLIGLRQEAGKRFCIAFWRNPETGLVRRQQWIDGIERANPVKEIWSITFNDELEKSAGAAQ